MKSPSGKLLESIDEIDRLCNSLSTKVDSIICAEEVSSSDLKLLGEYRQSLKLRIDVMKNLTSQIDEARFQMAVLNVLKTVDENIHREVVGALWKLEAEWDDAGDDFDTNGDTE